jgi:excisionase family DNA binding protein
VDDEQPVRAVGDVTDRLLTAAEIAELLNVPERWIRERTRSGLIPSVPLGRYRRYRREAVIEWIAAQEQGGAAWRKHHPRRADRT